MTQRQKVYERIKNNPKSVRFNDLKKLLLDKDFELKRSVGSHFVFSKGTVTFVIPSHNN